MRPLVWALRALIFFTLFAFSLNNEQQAVVNGFFGTQWRAPMVIIVLTAFAAGAALGVLAMVPGWWRHRQVVRRIEQAEPATGAAKSGESLSTNTLPKIPPRDGL